jgi:alpha-beta hydrolase superfamily lysophospholipase
MSELVTSHLASSIALDLYSPHPLLTDDNSSLVILILQGVEIDKAEYAAFASELSQHQFWVIVPNCFPKGRDYLCPEESSVAQIFSSLKTSSDQSLGEALQRGVILLGHSAGGMAAFGTLGANSPEIAYPLVALITYGSNAPPKSRIIKPLPPLLMLSGEQDATVPSAISRAAFEKISAPIKKFIELPGLNHYSINDSSQPQGSPQELGQADCSNQDSIKLIASTLTSFIHTVVNK